MLLEIRRWLRKAGPWYDKRLVRAREEGERLGAQLCSAAAGPAAAALQSATGQPFANHHHRPPTRPPTRPPAHPPARPPPQADHIFLMPHDEGACYAPTEMWGATYLVHWGRKDREHKSQTGARWPAMSAGAGPPAAVAAGCQLRCLLREPPALCRLPLDHLINGTPRPPAAYGPDNYSNEFHHDIYEPKGWLWKIQVGAWAGSSRLPGTAVAWAPGYTLLPAPQSTTSHSPARLPPPPTHHHRRHRHPHPCRATPATTQIRTW
jgi:hypothetical protein